MAAPAAALRLLRRRPAAPPPSPMLRSLFPASYSQAAAAAASHPAVSHTPPLAPSVLRHYCREVTPRKAPPKVEQRCCNTVPSTKSDSTKSLLDKLKDLKDGKKSLQDRAKNIQEQYDMVDKAVHDSTNANALFKKRLSDFRKLNAKIRHARDASGRIDAMYSKLEDEYDKDWAIKVSSDRLIHKQIDMLIEEMEDYRDALRRHQELERSAVKVAKVCAAVGLGGVLLLILAKILE